MMESATAMAPGISDVHMWATFALIVVTFALYVMERWSLELISVSAICVLMLMFHVWPLLGPEGEAAITTRDLLSGFANPALLAVLALLVLGNGMIRTGVLELTAREFLSWAQGKLPTSVIIVITLVCVAVVSAFLNNTPVVVLLIPVMQMLAEKVGHSTSWVMMPLSFAAILGGMTTLIGSSTNLLVDGALGAADMDRFGFFDFTVFGSILAAVGLVYVVLVMPRLLPERRGLAAKMVPTTGKQFVAQLGISRQSDLVGERPKDGHFTALPGMTVQMVQRGEQAILPPFEGYEVVPGDILIVAATRAALRDALHDHEGLFHADLGDGRSSRSAVDNETDPWKEGDQALAEAMVVPGSRLIGLNLRQIGFRYKTHCIVLGIQRRQRMIRQQITDIPLESGDVLLLQGPPDDIARLRGSADVVLMEWSQEDLPRVEHAKTASLIFLAVVGIAATGLLPIVITAIAGAAAMVMFGVLTPRQAFRSIDSRIVTTIAAALAMSMALQATGGAQFLSNVLFALTEDAGPATMVSVVFLIAAVATNLITNNAVAVLLTPIAVNIAGHYDADPLVFALAVLFGANCSFASPLGYQTNLLVMGPGHYRFADYPRAGIGLVLILWATFSFLAPMFYEL